MGQSLAKNLVHLIFSTKHREAWLTPNLRSGLHAYLGGILRDLHSPTLAVNSVWDHVHVLLNLHKTQALAGVVMEVKRASSIWMKQQPGLVKGFRWQNGYGAFSIGQSGVEDVRQYIANQEEHHRVRTFQEEFREFLRRYEFEFDERYVWD
jgi:putative transposase